MLEIKNNKIMMVLEFLRNDLVTEESMENIHRMRIVKNLEEYAETLEEERVEIIKKYAEKDENGEVIQSEEGNVTIHDSNGLNAQLDALFGETYTIENKNLKTAVHTVAQLDKNHKGRRAGDSSEAHYILVEELESYMEEE